MRERGFWPEQLGIGGYHIWGYHLVTCTWLIWGVDKELSLGLVKFDMLGR